MPPTMTEEDLQPAKQEQRINPEVAQRLRRRPASEGTPSPAIEQQLASVDGTVDMERSSRDPRLPGGLPHYMHHNNLSKISILNEKGAAEVRQCLLLRPLVLNSERAAVLLSPPFAPPLPLFSRGLCMQTRHLKKGNKALDPHVYTPLTCDTACP